MTETNYEVERGDTFCEQLSFVYVTTGLPVDITGWTIFFTIKKRKTDTDSQAVVSKTITNIPNPTLGVYVLEVPASELDTLQGVYYYDFQIKLTSGEIYTLARGTITFDVDITRRIV